MPHWILAGGCEGSAPRSAAFHPSPFVERGTKAPFLFSQTETRKRQHYLKASRFIQEQLTRISLPFHSPSRFFTASVFNCIRERDSERGEIFGITNFMGRKGSLFREGKEDQQSTLEGSKGEERADGFGASE